MNFINIKSVTMRNFLSIGAVTQGVSLDAAGLTLVLGENHDSTNGKMRNGSGKTALLQAVHFAFYGKALTKIKIPNLVNNINGKQMMVSVDFTANGIDYRVERGKKPDFLRLYVKGEEFKGGGEDNALGENRHTLAEIERVIGMSSTMFKHIVGINTYTDPFLKMSAGDQKAVIEELLGITQLSQRAANLKANVDTTKDSLKSEKTKIDADIEANKRIENAIAAVREKIDQWDRDHQSRLERLSKRLQEVADIDFDHEIKMFEELGRYESGEKLILQEHDLSSREAEMCEREIKGIVSQIKSLDQIIANKFDPAPIERDVNRKRDQIERHVKTIEDLRSDAQKVQDDIDNGDASTCICCGQNLAGTDHLQEVLEKLREQKSEIEHKIVRETKLIEALSGEIGDLEAEKDRLSKGFIERAETSVSERDALSERLESENTKLSILKEKLSPEVIQEKISSLGERPVVRYRTIDDAYRAKQDRDNLVRDLQAAMAETNPMIDQLDVMAGAIKDIDHTNLNNLTLRLAHEEFLYKLLTNKDSFIRKKIIDQNLSYLNDRVTHYLEKLGLPHRVSFQSDMSVNIDLMGRDYDYEQMSRGEMNRVTMATSWSFRDVWESMNTSINLMWIDEMLDSGMCSSGAENALSILKGMARDRNKNIFLVSHREELTGKIDRTLWVRKIDDFTTVEEE